MSTPEQSDEPAEVDDVDPMIEPLDTQATGDYSYPPPAGVDDMAPEESNA
jgi:hypothetical protein